MTESIKIRTKLWIVTWKLQQIVIKENVKKGSYWLRNIRRNLTRLRLCRKSHLEYNVRESPKLLEKETKLLQKTLQR